MLASIVLPVGDTDAGDLSLNFLRVEYIFVNTWMLSDIAQLVFSYAFVTDRSIDADFLLTN